MEPHLPASGQPGEAGGTSSAPTAAQPSAAGPTAADRSATGAARGAMPPGYPALPYPPPYYPPRRPTNNMAIAALVVALVSLFSCQLIGGVAVYLGNRARAEIRISGEEGDGLALAGVIVGWCAVAVGVLTALLMIAYLGFFAMFWHDLANSAPY